jgi:hypothetical protein
MTGEVDDIRLFLGHTNPKEFQRAALSSTTSSIPLSRVALRMAASSSSKRN